MAEPLVIYADVSYRPIEHWAVLWNVPASTIKSWIAQGKCPAKKIGGRWMISQMELLNWTPPAETETTIELGTDGQSEGRGDVRNAKARRAGKARKVGGQRQDRWPV